MKIFENSTGSLLIVIPRQLARAKGWKKGQFLEFSLDKDKIILEEQKKKKNATKKN